MKDLERGDEVLTVLTALKERYKHILLLTVKGDQLNLARQLIN